jgi:hypothetical protein
MIEIVSVYWVKIFATLVVFITFIVLFLNSSNAKSNIYATELVKKELDQLGDSYIVFDNVTVQSDRGMSLISYVVVSPYGIFVVTLCDLRGKISGHRDDREWMFKGKGVSDTILNPLWENRKHVNALEKKLGSQPFIPAVIFTHAKLVDDFGSIAVCVDQLQFFFSKYKRTLIDSDDLESVVSVLNENTNQTPP